MTALTLSAAVLRRETRTTGTFPSVTLPMRHGGVPVEVNLVARLGRGIGTRLFFEMLARQREHARFVDALDEPSAKLGSTDFGKGDATALYSFAVGHGGHPFHRHAGHRVFTAISGSGGAQLRFSDATSQEIEHDPRSFMTALRHVDVPPDCLFTVRFSAQTWHQFAPLAHGSAHPALFALSTHTNELGGDLSDSLRERVLADRSDIPSLTELLPPTVLDLLRTSPPAPAQVPTTALSLHDRPGGLLEAVCRQVRSALGHYYRIRSGTGARPGFVSVVRPVEVIESHDLPADSLLSRELCDRTIHHQDRFTLRAAGTARDASAAEWLAALLDGFLANRPSGVSRLMALRNVLVRPLKLRTSPLGCPVSSLLGPAGDGLFADRFPVRSQAVSSDGQTAEVILGADDKHLVFRSSVGVRVLAGGSVELSLATRVACSNAFGRLYMALISATHRKYIAPTMLAHAADAARATLLAARPEAGRVPSPSHGTAARRRGG